MGSIFTKQEPTSGTVIVDSVVITNSSVVVSHNYIHIPLTSLATGQKSILNIDKQKGNIEIIRSNTKHDYLINEIYFNFTKNKIAPSRGSFNF